MHQSDALYFSEAVVAVVVQLVYASDLVHSNSVHAWERSSKVLTWIVIPCVLSQLFWILRTTNQIRSCTNS